MAYEVKWNTRSWPKEVTKEQILDLFAKIHATGITVDKIIVKDKFSTATITQSADTLLPILYVGYLAQFNYFTLDGKNAQFNFDRKSIEKYPDLPKEILNFLKGSGTTDLVAPGTAHPADDAHDSHDTKKADAHKDEPPKVYWDDSAGPDINGFCEHIFGIKKGRDFLPEEHELSLSFNTEVQVMNPANSLPASGNTFKVKTEPSGQGKIQIRLKSVHATLTVTPTKGQARSRTLPIFRKDGK